MANDSVIIEVTQVNCIHTSEMGDDEVYIKYTVDGGRSKRFPAKGYTSLSKGDSWDNVGLRISYKDNVNILLCDSDPGKDDPLGNHTYIAADASKNETTSVSNTNGAEYTIVTEPG